MLPSIHLQREEMRKRIPSLEHQPLAMPHHGRPSVLSCVEINYNLLS